MWYEITVSGLWESNHLGLSLGHAHKEGMGRGERSQGQRLRWTVLLVWRGRKYNTVWVVTATNRRKQMSNTSSSTAPSRYSEACWCQVLPGPHHHSQLHYLLPYQPPYWRSPSWWWYPPNCVRGHRQLDHHDVQLRSLLANQQLVHADGLASSTRWDELHTLHLYVLHGHLILEQQPEPCHSVMMAKFSEGSWCTLRMVMKNFLL